MDLFKHLLLGLIQGLTEFLPVSSSGHLVLGSYILGFRDSDAAFEVLLHFGSLLSVLVYFRKDLLDIIKNSLRYFPQFLSYAVLGLKKDIEKDQLYYPYYSYYIVIASIPAAVIALLYKDEIEAMFSDPMVAVVCLFITGLIMILSRFAKELDKKINVKSSFLIGLAQAFAILPGISRSGSTIVTGMFLGLKREAVAKFSFLMSVPVILGAFVLKLKDLLATSLSSEQILNYSLATLMAAISGYLAIYLVMDFVKKGKFEFFGYYCILISILGFIFI